ncbi:hypothetical protein T484DRAFT_1773171 [Baffinella frigidus]|nr:hypothetical protein T484DRAFT_1773171 [Cryptophyta sp. CCMP2293]
MASLLGFLKGGVDGVGGKAATRRRMRFEVDVTASTTPIKIVSAELVEMQKAKITVMSSMQHSERGPLSKIFKLQVKAVTLDEKRRVASSVVLAGGDVDVALFAPGHAEQAKATMKTFVVDRRIKSRSSSSHPVNIQAVVTCTWVGPRLVGSAAWPSEEQHVRAHERGSGEASPGDLSDMSYDSDVDGAEHSILTADHQIQSRLVMSDASHLPGTRAHPSSRASLRSHLVGGEDGDEPETGTTEVSLLASARGSSSSSLPSKAVALQLKAAMPSAVLLPTGALASAHLPTFSPVKSRTVDGTTEAAGKKRAGGGGGASAGTGKSFADDQSLIEEARVEGAGVMPEEGVEREGCGGDAREEELAMLREEAAARERDLRTMRAALEASEVRLASVLARIRKGAPPTNQEGRVSKAGVGGAEEMHRGGWKLLEREVDDLEAQMRAKSLAVEEAAADALEHQKLSADALRHRDAAREERDAARGERGVVEADCAALRKVGVQERDDLRLRLRKLEAREGEEAAMEEAGRLERKVEALKSAVKDQAADKERSEKSAADAARLLAGEAREAQAKAARLEAASREAAAGAARAEAKAREELEAARLQADAAVRGLPSCPRSLRFR